MRFTINIATRTHIDLKMVNRACYVVLALLLAILIWNISRFSWGIGELRRLQADNTSYETQLNSRPSGVSEKDFTRLLADITFYNGIIGRKSYDWLGMLEQLEVVTPEGIALTALVPDTKSGEIKIDGHARSFAQVRSYIEKLEDSKAYTSILLLSHSNIVVGEKGKGVQFSISCKAALQ
ncbi:MAG: PilN domain-containing protein [Geobacteraceae bacterium]|nr:PilN domain-containing protein [Geobacteraceae bacterium]